MYFFKNIFIRLTLALLRFFPPELASQISLISIKYFDFLNVNLKTISNESSFKKIKIMDLTFDNYLGLSAGIDKSGKYFDSLNSLGFSFIEVGTFTPLPQKGNNYPRIKRLPNKSLINSLGFNNPGILDGIRNIRKNKHNFSGVLGISIGKNKSTPLDKAYEDYNFCLEHCFKDADYIAINISSPNTLDLRKLSSTNYIDDLTREINLKREKLEKKHFKKVPLLLKLSPDENEENLQKIISTSLSNNFSGFIISNTMKGTLRGISGGISGNLLKNKSGEMLRKVQGLVGDEVTLIASGGISTKVDVEERLDNGAKLIQIYTSFVYRGPSIVNELLN